MIYRFSEFKLDPSLRELRAGGVRRDVEPKTFDLLVYLLENRDRAVSKDEILEAVWPRQIVTDTALTRAIMKARRAVADDAATQAVIRTVHGHGYRFVADVQSAAPPEMPPESPPAPGGAVEGPPRLSLKAVAAGILAVIVGAAALWWLAGDEAPIEAEGSVAVLPVDNRSGDVDTDWTRLGLMSLMQRMLEEGGVDVVSDRSVLGALGDEAVDEPPDVEQSALLRQRTGAAQLLYTSLARDGGLFRLSAVLQHADGRSTRRVIVGKAPAELAADMAGLFATLLEGQDLRRAGRFAKTSTDPFVNELYARALDLELAGKPAEARTLFQLAAEQQPELFWLRYEIALCTRDLREWDEATRQFDALYEEARNGDDPRAMIVTLNSHGVMELTRNRYDAADELFSAADETASRHGLPSDRAAVQVNLALIATRRGRFDEADGHFEAALDAWQEAETDPPPIFLNNYAGHLLRQGQLEEARRFSERAVDGFRVMGHRRFEAPSLNRLGRILRRLGDLEASLARHREAQTIYRELGNLRGELSAAGGLTTTYRASGDLSRATLTAEDALERAADTDDDLVIADTLMRMGQVTADAGRQIDAIDYFNRALALFGPLGDDAGIYGARSAVATAYLDDGNPARAQALVRALLAEAEEAGQTARVARLGVLAGRIEEALGNESEALTLYRESLASARERGDLALLPSAAVRLGELELRRGNIDVALSLAEEARPYGRIDRDLLRFEVRLALAAGDGERAMELLSRLRDLALETWSDDDQTLLELARSTGSAGFAQPCDSSRPNSILMQRSITTSTPALRARSAASSCTTPI